MKSIWFQKTGVDLFMKIYVKASIDFMEQNARRCFNIMKQLRKLSDEWWDCIGDLSDYKQNGLYNEDAIFDCVEDLVDSIDEEIWEADGVLDLRNEIISILDAVS